VVTVPVPDDHLRRLLALIESDDAAARERGADEATDCVRSYSPAQVGALAGTLARRAATEDNMAALEAQLHAVVELGASGLLRRDDLSALAALRHRSLSPGLAEYVTDLLDEAQP
jgi:hypothetical protein